MNNEVINESDQSKVITDPLMQLFLQTQHQKVLNEAEAIRLKAKALDNSKDLSIGFLEIEAKLRAEKPTEDRRTITRIAYICSGFLLISFGFVGYCLQIGKEVFLVELIKVVLYPILTMAGYYFGKRSKDKVHQEESFLSPSITTKAEDTV